MKHSMSVDYQKGLSTYKLSTKYGLTKYRVRAILKHDNIKMRSTSEAATRHPLDDAAFDTLTEESAYWLGFLLADGSIHADRYGEPVIKLCLQARDKTHVMKFKKFLRAGHKIIHRMVSDGHNKHPAYQFQVRSQRLASKINNWWGNVAKIAHNRNFWRGMVDGDGSIQSQSTRAKGHRLRLVGTKDIIDIFRKEFVLKLAPHSMAKVRLIGNNLYELAIVCNIAKTVVHAMYNRCSVSLDRKLELANGIVGGTK